MLTLFNSFRGFIQALSLLAFLLLIHLYIVSFLRGQAGCRPFYLPSRRFCFQNIPPTQFQYALSNWHNQLTNEIPSRLRPSPAACESHTFILGSIGGDVSWFV